MQQTDFIIIDDSELDCVIAEKLIKRAGLGSDVKSFLQAADALDYIKTRPSNQEVESRTIVLLDILMPLMSGIDFMEEFEKLPENVQANYTILAFTSSMNKKDMSRMKGFKSVKHIFDKPISEQALIPIVTEALH